MDGVESYIYLDSTHIPPYEYDGAMLGATVGAEDGEKLGAAVGAGEGLSLGADVGSVVGPRVGLGVSTESHSMDRS